MTTTYRVSTLDVWGNQVDGYEGRLSAPEEDKRKCSECLRMRPAHVFAWVHDAYRIPYRKVCDRCFEKVRGEIADWRFDADDAGESLDG